MTAKPKMGRAGSRRRLRMLSQLRGLRRGDAVTVDRQHVQDGVLTLRTQKTGETVLISLLPGLAASIAAGPTGDLNFIVSEETGQPMAKESFGDWSREICKAAKRPGSARGLRKGLATKLANEERHGPRTPRHLRMARRRHGVALYPQGGSRAACRNGDETIEGRNDRRTFYSRSPMVGKRMKLDLLAISYS